MNYIDYLCKLYIVTYILNRMLDVNHIFCKHSMYFQKVYGQTTTAFNDVGFQQLQTTTSNELAFS
jgi:hypothetical protein